MSQDKINPIDLIFQLNFSYICIHFEVIEIHSSLPGIFTKRNFSNICKLFWICELICTAFKLYINMPSASVFIANYKHFPVVTR